MAKEKHTNKHFCSDTNKHFYNSLNLFFQTYTIVTIVLLPYWISFYHANNRYAGKCQFTGENLGFA